MIIVHVRENYPVVYRDATTFEWDHDGDLVIYQGDRAVAVHARGAWKYVQIHEENAS